MDPLTIGLLGGLLGGGTEQNVTTTQTFALAFNPSIVTNIGGGVSASPPGGSVTAIPTTTASTVDTPSGGIGGLGGLGGSPSFASGSARSEVPAAGMSPQMIIIGLVVVGGAVWFFGKEKQ